MGRYVAGVSSAFAVALTVTAFAAVPSLVNYQGVLQDGSGSALPDGNYSVKFHLYDDPTAGTLLWAETLSVNTTGGVFSVLLGGVHPLGDSIFAGPDRYVGMSIGGDQEMLPRTRMVTVGYAHRVATVDGATGGRVISKLSIGPGCTNNGLKRSQLGKTVWPAG